MKFKDALRKLNGSDSFKDWLKNNNKCFLAYGFIMISDDIVEEWQIGYYNPGSDTVTTFAVSDKSDEIGRNPESEVFRDESKVHELDLKELKISLEDALKSADMLQKEKYSAHSPMKKMAIIQKLDIGQVWNITYITKTFKTLNLKIDASSGKIVKDDFVELFTFQK